MRARQGWLDAWLASSLHLHHHHQIRARSLKRGQEARVSDESHRGPTADTLLEPATLPGRGHYSTSLPVKEHTRLTPLVTDLPGQQQLGRDGDAPCRRSSRPTVHAPDLGSQRNILPLRLEESNAMFTHRAHDCISRKETPTPDNNPTFETRWDSLRGKKKVRSMTQLEKRPPGWEDVMRDGKKGKIQNFNMDEFCPSFVIKESPKVEHSIINSQTLTSLIISGPVSDRPRRRNHRNIPQPKAVNAFDFTDLSEKVENINPESYIQRLTISTSNVAPESASSSLAMTTPAICSHSFNSENFSFCDINMKDAVNSAMQETPRSYSEAHLYQTLQDTPDVYFHSEDPAENINNQLCNDCVHGGSLSEITPKVPAMIKDPLSIRQYHEACDDGEGNKNTTEDAYHASPHSFTSLPDTTTVGGTQAGLIVTDSTRREHWITFDGSMENLDLISDDAFDFSSADNSSTHDVDEESHSNCQTPENTPASVPSSDDHHKSILDEEQRNVGHTTGNYKARLVRTYSQRGRRASKRVINSVSRRISTVDYGKLVDPVSPIYSKAVLTMQSGPGLFEKVQTSDDKDTIKSERRERLLQGGKDETEAVESPLTNTTISLDEVASTSSLEPPRVGSVRVPRLTSALVRRSVSLNISRVEREVPFQRLPDRRPGSFRKAISGLGALARSFTKKSGNDPTSTSETRSAAPDPGLCRSSSFATSNRQTPQAPRLPRRATSHKHVTPTDT